MKGRSWLWFVASALLALLAGVLAVVILYPRIPSEPEEAAQAGLPVVVAAQSLAAQTTLRADMLRVEERQVYPSGAAVEVQDVLGKDLLRDVASGEVIRMQDLTNVVTPSITLENELAVALPADDILSQWGAVAVGDHVDVLFTLDTILETPMNLEDLTSPEEAAVYQALPRDQSMDNVSVLALQNLEVVKIIEEPQPEAAQEEGPPPLARRALVLKIDPQDAVVLKYLGDSVAMVDLALRSPTNATLFDVQPVNINYLMLRYGIVVPQPLQ